MKPPGTDTPDILVIGGGIIGCSLARELARASRSVVVVERGRVGSGASTAAAGLLAPAVAGRSAGLLRDLTFSSAAGFEPWVEELRADGAGDVGFRRAGLLEVWTDAAEVERTRSALAELARPNRRAELLSGEELARLEPSLVSDLPGAVYYPDDAQVNPVRLMHAVARVAELAGVRIREHEPVLQLECVGDRVTMVRTASTRFEPGLVVLTAGAWSGELAGSLGMTLPTRPVKGQMILADCRVAPVRTPLFGNEALFVPRADGRLMLGVTVEEAGYDDRVTLEGVRTILQDTSRLVPSVGQLGLARAWAGLRPATPDEWPYMGPALLLRNLWVSTGHFRKGILLAPICARLMARSILAGHLDEELIPFKPTRRLTG